MPYSGQVGKVAVWFLAGGRREARFICEIFHKVIRALILKASSVWGLFLLVRLYRASTAPAATRLFAPKSPPNKDPSRQTDDGQGSNGLEVSEHDQLGFLG